MPTKLFVYIYEVLILDGWVCIYYMVYYLSNQSNSFYSVIGSASWILDLLRQVKLEQLERLRSEIPPAAPWLPILVIHIRSQVKTTQSQNYKF